MIARLAAESARSAKRSKEEVAAAILDEVATLLEGADGPGRTRREARDGGRPAERTSRRRIAANLRTVIHAPDETLELAVLCLLSEGHLIIEDFPGVGKTTLAKALARSVDCSLLAAPVHA